MIEGVVVAYLLMNRNRDKGLDEIVQFEDRVTPVLGGQPVVIDVRGRDLFAAPDDGLSEAAFALVLEEIGRLDG